MKKHYHIGLTLALSLFSALCIAQKKPVPVIVAEVSLQPFVDEIEALGTLQANENVELTSTVTELVTDINFDDGERVKKGTLLVQMDAADERAMLVEEQSRQAEAQRQVERLAPLVERGAASRAALDTLERELQTSQARILAVKSQIRQRQVIAPFDGVLGQRNISVGSLSRPGVIITTIDDDSQMKLDFKVPELFLPYLINGTSVKATASAWPDQIFEGSISSVNSRIDPITRSISVRAILDNSDRLLRPGMLMRVQLQSDARDAFVIPEEALIVRGSENSVMRIVETSDGLIVERAVVELGSRRRGDVEIIRGLNVGDQVVTHGTLRIRPKSAVEVIAVEKNNESLQSLLKQEG